MTPCSSLTESQTAMDLSERGRGSVSRDHERRASDWSSVSRDHENLPSDWLMVDSHEQAGS